MRFHENLASFIRCLIKKELGSFFCVVFHFLFFWKTEYLNVLLKFTVFSCLQSFTLRMFCLARFLFLKTFLRFIFGIINGMDVMSTCVMVTILSLALL